MLPSVKARADIQLGAADIPPTGGIAAIGGHNRVRVDLPAGRPAQEAAEFFCVRLAIRAFRQTNAAI